MDTYKHRSLEYVNDWQIDNVQEVPPSPQTIGSPIFHRRKRDDTSARALAVLPLRLEALSSPIQSKSLLVRANHDNVRGRALASSRRVFPALRHVGQNVDRGG